MTYLAHVPARPPIKQDDRVIAAAAHLAFFTGFWLIGPIAVYLIKRKESRFAAFHGAQAAIAQLLYGGLATVGVVGIMVVSAIAMPMGAAWTDSPVPVMIALIFMVLAPVGVAVLLPVLHLVGAYRAWQGETWLMPIAGRLALRIVDADEGALKV